MFARLTRFQGKIDKADEAIELFKNSIIPAAKSQKGFCGIYFFIDRKTGSGVSIAFWDSEEDAIANEKSGYYQEQLVKFMDFLATPSYIREGYDVVVQAD
ncbi:MAG: antibiotic biosynthesis monooxygenase [Candidatus Aminicenantes bacterium]|nr:MAG: antibiotic biosynthesis monooxygenase [Candidatus Aminicenantes bacterium]